MKKRKITRGSRGISRLEIITINVSAVTDIGTGDN